MNIADLLRDIADNGPVDWPGNWLLEAKDRFTDLFDSVIDSLDSSPETAPAEISRQNMFAGVMIRMVPHWLEQLQALFRERLHDGTARH